MTQYVLYNTCFGGFTFNREFVLSLFKRFPPDTPEGQKFFPKIINDSNIGVDDGDGDGVGVGVGDGVGVGVGVGVGDGVGVDDGVGVGVGDGVVGVDDDNFNTMPFYKLYREYKPRKIINLKTKKCYYLNTHMQEHRANPNLIKFLFERVDSLSEERFNEEYDKLIKKLCARDKNKIVNEDRTKKYTIHNWKESDIILSHMLTINISGSHCDLQIEQVKPELTWRITDYDGSETVVVKFDYYKLIQELINELQINKITPSTGCSEIIANLINGKITIKDLREFERS
jgi:hypothetical protein